MATVLAITADGALFSMGIPRPALPPRPGPRRQVVRGRLPASFSRPGMSVTPVMGREE
jgi:hypothetical protein